MTDGFLYPLPDPDAVPEEVSRAQAKIILTEDGLWGDVETAVAAYPGDRVQIWLDEAGVWRRDHPYVHGVALELGLTDAEVDDLFRRAARVL